MLIKKLILLTTILFLQPTNTPPKEKLNLYKKAGISSYFELNYPLAIRKLGYVIRYKPDDPEPYYYRALSKYGMENFSSAVFDLNKAIELDSSKSEYYFAKGQALYSMRKFEEAIFVLNKSIKLDQNNGVAYYIRASCHKHEGNLMGTCEDLFEAYDLNVEKAEKKIKKYCKADD